MNFNLSVFWTLVVVVIVAPVLTLALMAGALLVAMLLGYNPDAF